MGIFETFRLGYLFFLYVLSYQANGDMAFGETKNLVIIESSISCQEKADLLDMLEVRPLPDMQTSIPLRTVWGEAGCEPYSVE